MTSIWLIGSVVTQYPRSVVWVFVKFHVQTKEYVMARGFKGSGAKVRGKTVRHGATGKVLSRHKSSTAARSAAKKTRKRNITSTMRSAKNRRTHGG